MRLALIQLAPRLLEVDANVQSALAMMESVEADLYLLPELFASGYTFATRAEAEQTAEEAGAGPVFAAMFGFARRRRTHVVYGFAERGAQRLYNSASVVGPQGHLGTYRKIHLFSREKLFFDGGKSPAPTFDLPFGRIGLMICFDWFFPEVARGLA
ncbi:MAG: nitrilase-related carbon-nitrogen hydrolase, partial [Terriglobales bacterium]